MIYFNITSLCAQAQEGIVLTNILILGAAKVTREDTGTCAYIIGREIASRGGAVVFTGASYGGYPHRAALGAIAGGGQGFHISSQERLVKGAIAAIAAPSPPPV